MPKISERNSPWWSELPRSKELIRDYGLLRSTLYLIESWPLVFLNRVLSQRWSKEYFPPPEFTQAVIKAGREILELDAARVSEGLFPLSLLKPENPVRHMRSLVGVLSDGVRVAWRMRNNQHHDLEHISKEELQELPDYYQRNFHFQSDGYLSASSAARYDHQVEILFKGATGAMRRLALPALVKAFRNKKVKLIELGAGSGSSTKQVSVTLPKARITAVDLSADYLQFARQQLAKNRNVDFLQADAAHLPFKDESFDGSFSIFMFHELPKAARIKVLKEAFRVLKPGGIFVLVDSIQWDDNPDLNWGLERFPKDFHEPFFKNYVRTPLRELFTATGFEVPFEESALLAKCIVGQKPS